MMDDNELKDGLLTPSIVVNKHGRDQSLADIETSAFITQKKPSSSCFPGWKELANFRFLPLVNKA